MKIKEILKQKEKKFEPIVLKLTIENEIELKELWNILNISDGEIRGRSLRSGKYPLSQITNFCFHFWQFINDKLKELNNEINN